MDTLRGGKLLTKCFLTVCEMGFPRTNALFNVNLLKLTRTVISKRILSTEISEADEPSESEVYKYPVRAQKDNSIFVWGCGEHGALGFHLQKKKKMKNRTDLRFRSFKRPLRLMFAEQHHVTDVAAGFGFTAFAVRKNHRSHVFGTGLNSDSQIGTHESRRNAPLAILLAPAPIAIKLKNPTKTRITGISAGRAHLVVATDAEGVFTLGNNAYGQCGRRIIEGEKYQGSSIIHNIPNIGGESAKAVECGQDHTLILTESGKVYSCGWGADGQTGLGHYNSQGEIARVLGEIEGETIVKLSSRSDCVLALNDKGEVFGWGNSEYSQLFKQESQIQQINKPIHISKCRGFGEIVDVATAGSYCMMLNEAGDVFTWGYGILGRGPQAVSSWTPQKIPATLFGRNEFRQDSTVTSICCGLNHSGAITNYGDVYIWGKNKRGCLGLGGDEDQLFPLRVALSARARKLSMGVDHTLALCKVL